jgi:hypothetical protein
MSPPGQPFFPQAPVFKQLNQHDGGCAKTNRPEVNAGKYLCEIGDRRIICNNYRAGKEYNASEAASTDSSFCLACCFFGR